MGPNAIFNPQFGALAGWSSIGSGNYHAAQLTVSKRLSANLQFDLNYTFSKSIDLGSGAESSGSFGGGFIVNSWDPGAQMAVSSYDTLHLVNAYGVWKLPVGRGQMFGNKMNKFLDAVAGGWQLTGIYHQSSGLPTSTSTGSVWPTNWQLSNPAMPTGIPLPAVAVNKNGVLPNGAHSPSLFATQADAIAAEKSYRQTFPGEFGLRNDIRVNGSWDIDTGLAKEFKMPYKEGHAIQIRWESFNLTNTAILAGESASFSMTSTSTWGRISTQRNTPRQMQFALRYIF